MCVVPQIILFFSLSTWIFFLQQMESQWAGISHMFKYLQVDAGTLNCSFQCLICLPKNKTVKASTTSASNLRTHVKVRSFFQTYLFKQPLGLSLFVLCSKFQHKLCLFLQLKKLHLYLVAMPKPRCHDENF